MSPNKNNSLFKDSDDLLHNPDKTLKWRESYYFNWVDLNNKISGFSTIGILPNEKRREFVFLLFIDNKLEFYYREPSLENYTNNVNKMLQSKKLSYKMIKPLQTWKITFNSRKFKFNLTFDTRFHLYNFGLGSSASWHQHFEGSGIITGEIKYKDGIIREIHGYGQRDKSWGYRNWHQFDKWYAGHFQFKNWSSGFRKDYQKNKVDLSGYIGNENINIPISQLEIETINDTDQYESPLVSTYHLTDAEGNSFNIKAKRLGEKSYIRFAREFIGGYTELFEQMVVIQNLDTEEIGTGMMEHLRSIKST